MCSLLKKIISALMTTLLSLLFTPLINAKNFSCNTDDVDKYIEDKKLIFLEIKTDKTRKWTKNYLRAVSNYQNGDIDPKYKKKFDADIKAEFSNGLVCSFPSKIRISGDRIDHLGWGGGIKKIPPSITSLDVRLLEKNINSIVKFKLFIPQTKRGENEILSTLLLTEIGYLAPITYEVPALFNEIKTSFLFQEKITKEFLESNYLREAPILEGDERFLFLNDSESFDRFGIARLLNQNWADKGDTSLKISKKALEILNKSYLEYLLGKHINKNLHDRFPSNPNSKISTKSLNQDKGFASLVLAIGGAHALRPHNRSFYFDPIYNHFRPIYYDGNSTITALNPDSGQMDFVRYGKALTEDEISGATYALNLLKNLQRSNFLEKIQNQGLNLSSDQLDQILENIISNLKQIEGAQISDLSIKNKEPYFSNYKSFEEDIISKKLVFSQGSKELLEVCDLTLDNCYLKKFNREGYSKLLEGRFKDSSDLSYIFIGNKEEYIKNLDALDAEDNNELRIYDLRNGSDLIVFGSSLVNINEAKREIYLVQKSIEDRFLIRGGKLENWNIRFEGIVDKNILSSQAFNENLLTGCLTLLDLSSKSLNVEVEGALCEDGLNLIRVDGVINNIQISNTSRDAFDADFSNLQFDNIQISNAGNDCIDLSSGDYVIKTAYLKNCGDKAISVGERSTLNISSSFISESNIGLASKDSSTIFAENVSSESVDMCFTAYNKKQEFWGGKITVDKHNCKSNQIFVEKASLIEFL